MTAPSPQARPGTLADLLARRGRLSADEALAVFRPLPGQVRALHDSGRLHATICPDNVLLVGGQPRLAEPSAHVDLDADAATCPAELAGVGPLPVGSIEEAAAALEQRGLTADPRRIDTYQLAALLIRLCTGGPVARFVRSPLAGAALPAAWRPVIDRALASAPGVGLADVGQVLAELEAIGTPPPREPPATAGWVASAETPADGEPRLPFDRLGPYRLVALLGRGGMGEVFLGLEDGPDRRVAVKVLRPGLTRNLTLVRRFQNEAGALARLDHPNLVPIHSVGHDRGVHYFAMQYVQGESLEERLRQRGTLSGNEAMDVLEGCLLGLSAAHEAGLVHRDVKPGNVLLEEGGRVRVADFGLVKDLEAGQGLTSTGAVMGTLGYLAPEQARGDAIDTRSDLYSLGVVAYRMLSGRLPFDADSLPAMLFQHNYTDPPPLADVEPGLARLVEGLMARRPAGRYASCAEALADLSRLRRGEPVAGPPPVPPVRLARLPELERLPDAPSMPPRPASAARLGVWLGLLAAREAESIDATTKQVDALVARYRVRRDDLAVLLGQGEELARELATQAAGFRLAAEAAARRAAEEQARRAESQAAALESDVAAQGQLLEPLRQALAGVEEGEARLLRTRDALAQRRRRVRPTGTSRRRGVRLAAWGGVLLRAGGLLLALSVPGWLPAPVPRPPGEADYRRGVAALNAWGRPYDGLAALTSFEKASEAGHALATGRLALCHFLGDSYLGGGCNVVRDEIRGKELAAGALEAIREATKGGDPEAATLLGLMHRHGVGVDRDAAEAVRYYRQAAEQNYPEAQVFLGLACAGGVGVKDRDDDLATRWLRRAADRRFPWGQYHLGVRYALGLGVKKDEEEAVRLYRQAADRNLPEAKVRLGLTYAYGLGVAKDDERAVHWFRHAAEQNNHPEAQVHLGLRYAQGLGVKKDDVEAARWLRRAAEQQFAWGQYHLGLKYAQGLGVERDEKEAVSWYRKAAELHWPEGQYALGLMTENGLGGVTKDKAAAIELYRKAAAQNYAPARKRLADLGVLNAPK